MEQPYSILVVDDDTTQLKIVERLLSKENYKVSLACSGVEAINRIKNGLRPDLMLLDITMPDMDGYHTYEAIKPIHNVPTIFLTAVEDSKAELTGLKLGAIDYITKPFELEILLARIKNHLDLLHMPQNDIRTDDEELVFKFDQKKLNTMTELLTESELRVGKLIAMGLTNQEIADQCNYSYTYIKKIAYRIFDKLQISKRNEIRHYFF